MTDHRFFDSLLDFSSFEDPSTIPTNTDFSSFEDPSSTIPTNIDSISRERSIFDSPGPSVLLDCDTNSPLLTLPTPNGLLDLDTDNPSNNSNKTVSKQTSSSSQQSDERSGKRCISTTGISSDLVPAQSR